jgi:hypothetical protein
VNRLALLVPAAAALLAACGGPPPTVAPPSSTAMSTSVSSPDVGTVVVRQDGTAPERTAWYVRIETGKAELVAEYAFPGRPISLTKQLPIGDYRIISWHRPCESACPTSGEKGLGPLAEVCGTPVTLRQGKEQTATVAIDPSGSCSVAVAD